MEADFEENDQAKAEQPVKNLDVGFSLRDWDFLPAK